MTIIKKYNIIVNKTYLQGRITMVSDGKNIFIDNKSKRKITESAVKELNQNSNLGYNLLCLYEDDLIKRIKKECKEYVGNYMSNDYYGDGILWVFSGYPHDEVSDSFLTEINFTSTKYNIFGIKPGDNISNSKKILENMGFENKGHYIKKGYTNVFSKGDLYITLTTDYDNELSQREVLKNVKGIDKKIIEGEILKDNQIIKNIEIEVKTFYLGNRIY